MPASLGRPRVVDRPVRVNLYLPHDYKIRLLRRATRTRRSMSGTVMDLLDSAPPVSALSGRGNGKPWQKA